MRTLRGKTAVITGAASGIGRALAERLARERMRLVLADVDLRRLRQVASALPGSLAVRADVSRIRDVEALAAKAYARFGAVHLLSTTPGSPSTGRYGRCRSAGGSGSSPSTSGARSTGAWRSSPG